MPFYSLMDNRAWIEYFKILVKMWSECHCLDLINHAKGDSP